MSETTNTKTSNTTKVAAGITAAALLAGGGVLTYNALTGSDEIDWSKYALDIPTINVPQLGVPKLAIAKLDIPVLSLDGNIVQEDNTLSNTGIADTTLQSTTLNTNDVYVKPLITGTETPKLSLPTDDLQEYQEFITELRSVFTDRRNLDYESLALSPANATLYANWMEIYKRYQNVSPIKFVPITNKFKMISEVSPIYTQKDIETLNENLLYYKSVGYDSVLVTFTKDDVPTAVLNTVKYIIKYHSLNVWLAYSGVESLKVTSFMEPDKYAEVLTSCAPYLTGYVNAWGRTSVHLWKQEPAFMNYTNYMLRLSNPNIPILGELYYGETAKYTNEKYPYGWDSNAFTNESGLVISNMGYTRTNFKYLFTKLLPKLTGNKDYPYVGLVIGPRPSYRSMNNLNYSSALEIKQSIENKFFEYNCIGTITLSSDGKSDGTNDLTKNVYNTL